MGFYTLGDAQIDAQNRTTDQIGNVLVQHDAMKSAGTLTAGAVQSFMNQVQGFIDSYNTQYGGTKRGAAGKVTLQTFVDQNIFPAWNQEIQSLSIPSTNFDPTPIINVPAIPNAQGGSGAGTVTNINIPGASPATPGNFAPSDTPGPPPGLTIPGVTQTVNAPYDLSPYYLPIAVGVALWFAFVKK